MTGDGGLALVILGALALVTSLAERVVAYHRWREATVVTVIEPALRAAFPLVPPAQELERLIVSADAAVESQKIARHRRRLLRRR
jgi:hypothetical protein